MHTHQISAREPMHNLHLKVVYHIGIQRLAAAHNRRALAIVRMKEDGRVVDDRLWLREFRIPCPVDCLARIFAAAAHIDRHLNEFAGLR